MYLSHEDIVTKLLSTEEILDDAAEYTNNCAISYPAYDLNKFLKQSSTTKKNTDSRYIFVK